MSTTTWEQMLAGAVERGTLWQLVLSRPVDRRGASKVAVRPLTVRGQSCFQWTERRGPQEFHENIRPAELLERVHAAFGPRFGDLHWFCAEGDFTARRKPGGNAHLTRKPPSKQPAAADHNRPRQHLLPEGRPCPFLHAIGVMTPDGRVKPTMAHKFRQINRFLEFIADILPHLPAAGPLSVVDFGCGKSYLTFALHHWLAVVQQREVEIVGLDRKRDVVEHCQQIADRLQCRGLTFRAGDIPTFQPAGPVHLAVSLHACDTATDDALAAALQWRCQVILAVPCCQHELQRTLRPDILPGLTGYGLLKERFCALATDALRARLLETRGYKTQVLEFIELEHTAKNVLLRAVRRTDFTPDQARSRQEEYDALCAQLGVADWHLERAASQVAGGTQAGHPQTTADLPILQGD